MFSTRLVNLRDLNILWFIGIQTPTCSVDTARPQRLKSRCERPWCCSKSTTDTRRVDMGG